MEEKRIVQLERTRELTLRDRHESRIEVLEPVQLIIDSKKVQKKVYILPLLLRMEGVNISSILYLSRMTTGTVSSEEKDWGRLGVELKSLLSIES